MTESTRDESTVYVTLREENDKIKDKRDEKKTPFLPRPIRDDPHPNPPKGTRTVRLYACMRVCVCVCLCLHIFYNTVQRRRVMVPAKTENGAAFVPW